MSGEGINEHGIPMCLCKRSGRVHAWEPGESCNPVRVVPNLTAPDSTPTERGAGDVGEVAAVLAGPLCAAICDLLGEPRILIPGEVRALLMRPEVGLAPLIAEREQAARAEAWDEVTQQQPFRVAEANRIRAEAAEAKVARVEALLAGYEAWTGADPFDEFASSPKQREQLRDALDGGGR